MRANTRNAIACEAEQLNDLERRNRTEGKALDDFSVARISSFLKSYGEMRKGEQFVMGEVLPPPPGIAGAASFGSSATMASVVTRRPAIEPGSCRAVRTTLAGSTMPALIMST